jgi:hypothetical protein
VSRIFFWRRVVAPPDHVRDLPRWCTHTGARVIVAEGDAYLDAMPDPIRSRPTSWTSVVFVCGKCARKLDGGYGAKGKHTLKSILRQALKESSRRREVRVIETRCMGVCPKHATTMLAASHPGTIYTVPEGTSPEDTLKLAID